MELSALYRAAQELAARIYPYNICCAGAATVEVAGTPRPLAGLAPPGTLAARPPRQRRRGHLDRLRPVAVTRRERTEPTALDGILRHRNPLLGTQTRKVLDSRLVVDLHRKIAAASIEFLFRKHQRFGALKP